MNIKSRGKKLVNSFKYAFNGFKLTFKNEQNMVIHIIVATIVTICGFIFKISLIEWCICLSLFALVIGAELMNTALENTVDLISKEKSMNAKVAKDTSAAFVLTFAILSIIIGLIIFVLLLKNHISFIIWSYQQSSRR